MALDATFRGRLVLDAAALGVAVLGLALTTRNDAGLAGPWVLVGLASALPVYLVARGWRLPWWMHAAAAALPVSVLVVSLAHGYGEGAARASRYGYGALLLLGVAAWASTPARRLAAAAAGALLVVDQYLTAWLPWWGSENPDRLMVGSFYWHNPFGAYCVIGAALAAVLAVTQQRGLMLLGYAATALGTAGALASGSRAAVGMLAAVLLVVLLLAVVVRGWRGAVRWVLLVGIGIGFSLLMSSALFFPPDPAIAGGAPPSDPGLLPDRSQPADGSVTARFEFWRAGILMGLGSPLVGVGLQNFGPTLVQYTGLEWVSSHPHSEFVLGWAEGGIVGFLPLLAVLVGAVWLVLRSVLAPLPGGERRIRRLPGREELAGDAGRWAGLLALVPAVAHAGFDFDWAYPSLVAVAGYAGGIAAAPLLRPLDSPEPPRLLHGLSLALIAVLAAAAAAGFLIDPLAAIPLMPLGGFTTA